MVDASTAKLTSMHFHGWEKGLKTGMYLGTLGIFRDFGEILSGMCFFLRMKSEDVLLGDDLPSGKLT